MIQQYADTIVLNQLGQVLLLQRAKDDDFMPGKWSLPGGKVEETDLSFFDAAARELAEETALAVNYGTASVQLPSYQNEDGSMTSYLVASLGVKNPLIVLDVFEHQKYDWVEPAKLKEMDLMFDLGQRIIDILVTYNQPQILVKARLEVLSLSKAFDLDLISANDYLNLKQYDTKPFMVNGSLIGSHQLIQKSDSDLLNMERTLPGEYILSSGESVKFLGGYIEKGKAAQIGEIRVWGGEKYVKHSDGWVHVNKNSGKVTVLPTSGPVKKIDGNDAHKAHYSKHIESDGPKQVDQESKGQIVTEQQLKDRVKNTGDTTLKHLKDAGVKGLSEGKYSKNEAEVARKLKAKHHESKYDIQPRKEGESVADWIERSKKPSSSDDSFKKEEPKKEPEKQKDPFDYYHNYDFKKHIDNRSDRYVKTHEIAKKQGIQYPNLALNKNYSREYIGDEIAKKIYDQVDKEHPNILKDVKGFSEILNTPRINFDILPRFSGGELESYKTNKKIPHEYEDVNINEKVKRAATFVLNHVQFFKKINSFCQAHGLDVRIEAKDIATTNGKSGSVKIGLIGGEFRNDSQFTVNIEATFDRSGNVDYHRLNDHIQHLSSGESSRKSIAMFNAAHAFSAQFNEDHVNKTNSVDEKWVELKHQYNNYYPEDRHGNKQSFSNVFKKDDNTLHFQAGDIGKKKHYQDTVRDAASLTPPFKIGDYKLVPDKVLNHSTGQLVDKSLAVSEMKKRDNEYHEYENNVDFTYVYKK